MVTQTGVARQKALEIDKLSAESEGSAKMAYEDRYADEWSKIDLSALEADDQQASDDWYLNEGIEVEEIDLGGVD